MVRNRYVLFASRLVVGVVFIWAGILKISNPLDFAQAIENYRFFPKMLSFFLALVLPWIEVICGLFLILGVFRKSSSLLVSLMLAGFLALVFTTMLRGIDVDCGCFGRFSHKAGFQLLVTDSLLLLLSLAVFFWRPSPEQR